MKTYKKNDKLIVEIDLFQHRSNPYDENEEKELTHNLLGVITNEKGWKDYTINQLIDLSYKDSQQTGMPYIHLEKEEFEKIVKELDLAVIEHPSCDKCLSTIFGSYTLKEGKKLCYNCANPG